MSNEGRPRALIAGITGQDGSYLAEFLLGKGYVVHGLIRRASSPNTSRIDHLLSSPDSHQLKLHYADLEDSSRLGVLLRELRVDEVYNLAAQSHVKVSFDEPDYTGDVTGLGATRLLEAVRASGRDTRYYQASTSEMFGGSPPPQNETTEFYPRSPYAAAKLYAYWMTRNYREAYGLFAVNGILFNHESPRRGETFVTRKITLAAARLASGRTTEPLILGNLEAVRDWGYAPEYVVGMWQMLQADDPDDFVLATGVGQSVAEFARATFEALDLDWERHVRIDEALYRPTEVDALIGDATKASALIGWRPEIVGPSLAELMVRADLTALEQGPGWVDQPVFVGAGGAR